MFRANGSQAQVLQENHYYPFGMEMEGAWAAQVGVENAYQYNGKELVEDFGLGWYDYGARWYMPDVGRFTGVDPLAEMYIGISPYAFTANNPIKYREVDGRYFEEGSKSEKQAKRIEKQAENKANKLERQANKLDAKGKTTGDLRDRAKYMTKNV